MKKIALFAAMLVCAVMGAKAQETKDSVWVVQGDTAATAIAVADGDYVSFTKPVLWHNVVAKAPTYYYYNKAYTWDYTYKTTIQQYGTTNYFYIDNFLNSGSGFTFKLMNNDGTVPEEIADINTFEGYAMPVRNEGVDVTDYGTYAQCYFYVGNKWGWTDAVNNVTYDYWCFYAGYGYSTFSGSDKYMCWVCYPAIANSGKYSTLYIDWH